MNYPFVHMGGARNLKLEGNGGQGPKHRAIFFCVWAKCRPYFRLVVVCINNTWWGGVQGQSLWWGVMWRNPLKLKHFLLLYFQRNPQICLLFNILARKKSQINLSVLSCKSDVAYM